MDARYYVSKALQKLFGYNLPIYFPYRLNKQLPAEIIFPDVTLKEEEEILKLSYLGTPIVAPTTFKAGEYRKYKANGELTSISLPDFQLPLVTLIEFRRAKNIIKTDMLGANGTVKEIYGMDDWVISFRGYAMDEPNKKAQDQIENLLKFEELADSIEVDGILFTSKNIHRLAIESIELGQLEAEPGTIPFTITASSDEALELVLTEKTLSE
ncbi:hypothetical protein ETU08_01750 [Apibacter muscae]|uniref:DUF6046 domain-containing protein n=1 Tax=Apibacter muscae TaxID=2509004 RepID=A0A563DJT7_9FLAO|nr:DUF6046 domain-containing protein [Apibacter muscae]TWP30508.1 hypothetical protein ETU09_00475 [Apibacter muscae]TWP31229.1 hypothetical protein ETU08_01750 [Apibacter muscae]